MPGDDYERAVVRQFFLTLTERRIMKKVFAIILGCIGLGFAIFGYLDARPINEPIVLSIIGLAVGLLGVIIALPQEPQ